LDIRHQLSTKQPIRSGGGGVGSGRRPVLRSKSQPRQLQLDPGGGSETRQPAV